MIRAHVVGFADVLRDGFRIWWLAPLIPLLAVVPEMVQHIAEIRIGFFDSRAAAVAVSDDPRRMIWGYFKIAGLLLAILAALRFWAAREQGLAWYSPRGVRWRALALGIALMVVTSLPEWLLADRLTPDAQLGLTVAITILTLPLLTYLASALIGDGAMTLSRAFTHGWWPALRIALFVAATWAPLQWLHGKNHDWAFGAPDAFVWALMAFDSLVVGLLAVMAGTAFHHGYALDSKEAPQEFTRP